MSLARALVAASFMVAASWLWGGRLRLRIRPTRQCGGRSDLLERWAAGGWARVRRGNFAERRRLAAAELCLALAAELNTGQALEPALRRAAGPEPVCPTAVAACELGADVAEALAVDAREWNLSVLTGLAAVWTVSRGSGAGLARAAEQLGRSALDSEQIRREMSAELAGPRATAAVLAMLPAVGLLLGSGLGGSPVSWLLGTPLGWAALAIGLALEGLGLLWVRSMVRGVERRL
ncbi:MAG: tight adherence protein [Actinomycetota bacterium]|nr:tight adherence protein [Actinomycetota bacterium]